MLAETLKGFEKYLLNQIPTLKKCERYKGEFEDAINWDADFPCLLWRLDDLQPLLDSAGKAITEDVVLSFHVADKDTNNSIALDLIEIFVEVINATEELQTENTYLRVSYTGARFKGYKNGVEVYVVTMQAQINKK